MKEGRGGRFRVFVPNMQLDSISSFNVFNRLSASTSFLGSTKLWGRSSDAGCEPSLKYGSLYSVSPGEFCVPDDRRDVSQYVFGNESPWFGPSTGDHTGGGSWDVPVSCSMRCVYTKSVSLDVVCERPAPPNRICSKSGA